jgi:uncharacterized protein YndB with AHSA1/START domain
MVDVTTPSAPSLRMRVRIDAEPDAVRAALTDADTLTEWFAEHAEVSLDDGRYEFWGRYTPYGDEPHQQLDSSRPLRFTWDIAGQASTVEIELEPDGDEATVVRLSHDGLTAETAAVMDCFWHVSLANLVAQCEGVATMPPFDFSAPAQGDALVRTVVDVPAEEVYASLLDPAQVAKWAGGPATIEAEVGGRYELGDDARSEGGPTSILELERDKVLAYGWRSPQAPDTVVRWQLREARGSTFLTLVHSGFTDDAVAERFRQGWPSQLVELKRVLELGPSWEPMKQS